MVWQDFVLAGLNVIFGYSLIPQVYHGFKKRKKFIVLQTALLTTGALYTQTAVWFTLKLLVAGFVSGFIAFLWTLLTIQSIIYKEDLKI